MTKVTARWLARAAHGALAAIVLGLVAASPTLAEESAVANEVTRIIDHERMTIDALGPDRLAALAAQAVPPAPQPASISEIRPDKLPKKLGVATLDQMPPVKGGDEQWRCLAEAIYFEARGEPLEGQIAVAEVVLNRVDNRAYPDTICGVTRQGASQGRGCQFSYACSGSRQMASTVSRERAEKLAAIMLAGRERTVTDGATHFHATYVRPAWSRKFVRTAAIGQHIFYRQGERVASN